MSGKTRPPQTKDRPDCNLSHQVRHRRCPFEERAKPVLANPFRFNCYASCILLCHKQSLYPANVPSLSRHALAIEMIHHGATFEDMAATLGVPWEWLRSFTLTNGRRSVRIRADATPKAS